MENATRSALSYLLSNHHLRQFNSKMKLPKFLRPPRGRRQTRRAAGSEISLVEGQSEADPAALRPTESTPDLRIGTSILPVPGPLAPHNQESSGMETISLRLIHLSLSLCITQTPTRRSLPAPPLTQEQHPGENRIGSPPRTLQPS